MRSTGQPVSVTASYSSSFPSWHRQRDHSGVEWIAQRSLARRLGPFLIPNSKFHGHDYFSTSWKLASASLDLAFVATVSPRYVLAVRVCPASVRDIQPSSLFIRYLTMATLSLYFFNLLPLPHLDGAELLLTILDFLFDGKQEPFVYDIEALETADDPETTRTRLRWKQRLGNIISIVTMSVFICCIILGMMNFLL